MGLAPIAVTTMLTPRFPENAHIFPGSGMFYDMGNSCSMDDSQTRLELGFGTPVYKDHSYRTLDFHMDTLMRHTS